MSDPTPEERARKHCDSPYHDQRPGLCSYCELLAREIRAAIEAEREACAKVAEAHHMYEVAAAIRTRSMQSGAPND
jgi:hypothetical protein